jgi:hypothetical protein
MARQKARVKRVWAILRFFTQFGFIVFTYLNTVTELISQRLRYYYSSIVNNLGVADFRDENNFAYVQDSCRDVPWNVSTSKNHTPIQQRHNLKGFSNALYI